MDISGIPHKNGIFGQKKSEIQSDVNELNAIATKLRQLTGKSKPDYIVIREVHGSGIQSSRVNTGQSVSPSDSIPDLFSEKVPQIRHKINKIGEEIERMILSRFLISFIG